MTVRSWLAVPDSAAGLVARGIAVRRGGSTILRDLDLRVGAGRLTVLVGPSGAGKTTLLRAIAGLERLDAGTLQLNGRDLGSIPTHRRGLAVVFQGPRLLPHLGALDNVAFPLRMSGRPRHERHRTAADLLDEVGLAGFEHRRPHQLSGGEQQRVALARALAGDPALLLLDEPLSAVDPHRREELRQLVASLQRRRRITTLYVTHDRVEAAALGDDVALLIEGRIVQQAPPEELFTRPTSAVVARFFGATNLLYGTVTGGALRLGAAGSLPVDAPDGSATVAIRPERLRLSDDGPLAGVVVAASFEGTYRRLVLDVAGPYLVAHVDPEAAAEVGDRVRVAVAPRHVWVLPQSIGTAAVEGEPG